VRADAAAVPLLLLLPAAAPVAATGPSPSTAAGGCNLPRRRASNTSASRSSTTFTSGATTPTSPLTWSRCLRPVSPANLLNFLRGQGVILTKSPHAADPAHGQRHPHVANQPLRRQPGQSGREQLSRIRKTGRDDVVLVVLPVLDGRDGRRHLQHAFGQRPEHATPWVPFTRAGWNFGGVGTANVDIENLRDVAKIYGPNSPQAAEVNSHSPNAFPDFVGIAVHCAHDASLCSTANGGVPDNPDRGAAMPPSTVSSATSTSRLRSATGRFGTWTGTSSPISSTA
jgi:hypothetical protein